MAHVGFSAMETMPSSVLGEGEEDSADSEEYVRHPHISPFSSGHLEWRCQINGPLVSKPVVITVLIDNGSHSVLIDNGLVRRLRLRRRQLPSPQRVKLAMGEEEVVFSEWVKLRVCSEDQQWTAQVVRAIMALKLAYPVLLGSPFLKSNKVLIDHEFDRVTAKDDRYQLLCHRYDFLVRLFRTDLLFFELFYHFLLLGLITTPHVYYVHMTYVYFLFLCFILHDDHMVKRSQYRIMFFYKLRSSILWTHSHPHSLLPPPQPHRPYTPRLDQTTTAPPGEGYHLVAKCGHQEDPDCT